VETLILSTLWIVIKNQLYNILHSFNLNSIVIVPTRIGPSSFSTIQNVFIDNSYLNISGIIPLKMAFLIMMPSINNTICSETKQRPIYIF